MTANPPLDTLDVNNFAPAGIDDIEGDEGTLTYDQRVCLVEILRQHYISDTGDAALWATLSRHGGLVRSRLNDLFLDLVVDSERRIAYKVQIRSDRRRFPVLLRDEQWTREATILLVFLRRKFSYDRAAGHDQVLIDREDLLDAVDSGRPPSTDTVNDRKRVDAAVKKLFESRILLKASDDETRFEVSSVVEAVLPIDRLRELQRWFIEQNRPGATQSSDFERDGGEEL